MKKILALTLVLVLVLAAFVGCKKTDATDKNGDAAAQKTTEAPLSEGIVGWYKAETVNGMSFTEWVASMFSGLAGEDETAPTMSEEELKEKLTSLGIDLDNFMSIELLEDGTAVMSSMGIASKGNDLQTVVVKFKSTPYARNPQFEIPVGQVITNADGKKSYAPFPEGSKEAQEFAKWTALVTKPTTAKVGSRTHKTSADHRADAYTDPARNSFLQAVARVSANQRAAAAAK